MPPRPSFLPGEGGPWGVEPPTKISKRGSGSTGSQLLEGGCWERGVDFFQKEGRGGVGGLGGGVGGCSFHMKKISEIFKKRVHKEKQFSLS